MLEVKTCKRYHIILDITCSLFTLQGISAVGAFFELLSQPSLSVQHPEENKQVAPAELCPILKRLYRILIKRSVLCFTNMSMVLWAPSTMYSMHEECSSQLHILHCF